MIVLGVAAISLVAGALIMLVILSLNAASRASKKVRDNNDPRK